MTNLVNQERQKQTGHRGNPLARRFPGLMVLEKGASNRVAFAILTTGHQNTTLPTLRTGSVVWCHCSVEGRELPQVVIWRRTTTNSTLLNNSGTDCRKSGEPRLHSPSYQNVIGRQDSAPKNVVYTVGLDRRLEEIR